MRGTWISVVGPIGVGKSTLAAVIARRTGALFVPERFGDNPFLERFYEPGGIARWGFQTETAFLTQRVDQVRELHRDLELGRSVVTDFAPQQNLVFARITLDAREYSLYEELYERLFISLPRPDRLVCLDAELRTILRRIRHRGRAMEAGIDPGYLRKLRAGYRQWQERAPAPVLWIDTTKLPIPSDLVARADVLDVVMNSLEPHARESLFGRPSLPPASLEEDLSSRAPAA